MTCWRANVADFAFLLTSLTLNFQSFHTFSTLCFFLAGRRAGVRARTAKVPTKMRIALCRHTPKAHRHSHTFLHSHTHTHTQTKQFCLAAVPLLMFGKVLIPVLLSHTHRTYVSHKQGALSFRFVGNKRKGEQEKSFTPLASPPLASDTSEASSPRLVPRDPE